MTLFNIILATFLSSIVSLVGAFLLAFKSKWSKGFSLHLTALSSGVLLTTALLHLAPEAAHESPNIENTFMAIFAGVISFFLLERLVLWYHHHHDTHHAHPEVWLITLGDSVHNFIDGVAIAATLMVNPALGIVTTIAIGAHEIPQEIADFAILINGGMSRRKALWLNVLSALTAFAGALLTYFAQPLIEPYLPFIVGFSAGMFLYIALADLIPELHHHTVKQRDKWTQLIWFLAGIILLFSVTQLLGDEHEHSKDEFAHEAGIEELHQIEQTGL